MCYIGESFTPFPTIVKVSPIFALTASAELCLQHFAQLSYMLYYNLICLRKSVRSRKLTFHATVDTFQMTVGFVLAVTLSGIGSALVCIAYMWIPSKSITIISVCGFVFTVASAYIIALAVQSPNPILKGTNTGSALVVRSFCMYRPCHEQNTTCAVNSLHK